MDRARLNAASSLVSAVKSFIRKAYGSALAAAASSSMNDSEAKVDCGPLGSRRFPVRSGVSQISGRLTTSLAMRRLGIAYISEGVAELPLSGLARLEPINWAINTVSGSL